MLLKSLLKPNLANFGMIQPIRHRIFSPTFIEPIIDKNELDRIQSADSRHYKQVKPPTGTESNSLLYHPRLEERREEKSEIEADPLKIFLNALDNCKPLLKLVSVNRGGITYQCPVPMSEKEREFKSTKFIVSSCDEKDRSVRFYETLANELIEASQNQGKSIKKKIDIHRSAEANRAYAHYRWSKN